MLIKTALEKDIQDGQLVEISGWIKTSRFGKNVSFLHLHDGSCINTVQVVLDAVNTELKTRLGIGAAVKVTGHWVKSLGAEQAFEIKADQIEVIGDCDPSAFPIQKKETSLDSLREIPHLRPKVDTLQSVFRIRNALSWQIHKFFQERNFIWVHTPIITGSDCEGAGQMFSVATESDSKTAQMAKNLGAKTPLDEEAFFGKPAHLTVSGQLHVEPFAQAFSNVYTFGPTFRAENSNTVRHASEFWMIEPEIAFADLDDVIKLASDFISEITIKTLNQCTGDFEFLGKKFFENPDHLLDIYYQVNAPPERLTYGEAQDILVNSGEVFEHPVGWGCHIQTEHEKFLAEKHVKRPVFITHYPIDHKSFYMKIADDQKTVACTDLLVPKIGEIIGGSQREHRLDVLQEQMEKRGMDSKPLDWYLDLRRFGTVPHGGFGLGLERMLMWITGMTNIRDVIPYPRTPGGLDY